MASLIRYAAMAPEMPLTLPASLGARGAAGRRRRGSMSRRRSSSRSSSSSSSRSAANAKSARAARAGNRGAAGGWSASLGAAAGAAAGAAQEEDLLDGVDVDVVAASLAAAVAAVAAVAASTVDQKGTGEPQCGRLWRLAESGVFTSIDLSIGWETTLQAAQTDEWLESVEAVFRYFEERTPGSRVERRDRTIRWSYESSDAELGAQQASNLVEHLEKLLVDAPVEKMWEGTTVEVRPHGSSCGHGLMQLLAAELGGARDGASRSSKGGSAASSAALPPRSFDFVLAMGNFTGRDEDLFLQLHSIEGRTADGGVDEPGMALGAADGAGDAIGTTDDAAATADAAAGGVEAPPLTLGAPGISAPLLGRSGTRRALDIETGGVFSVVLGNRLTHARFFLPSEREATQLLHALTLTPQSPQAAADTRELLASQAAQAQAAAAAADAQSAAQAAAADAAASSEELLPNALSRATLVDIAERMTSCLTPAFCLDYDGTLSPMVADPMAARLPGGTRALLSELCDRHPTAIVSGRSMEKLRQWVQVDGLYFAGSHGFEIVGPSGSQLNYTVAHELLPTIQACAREPNACHHRPQLPIAHPLATPSLTPLPSPLTHSLTHSITPFRTRSPSCRRSSSRSRAYRSRTTSSRSQCTRATCQTRGCLHWTRRSTRRSRSSRCSGAQLRHHVITSSSSSRKSIGTRGAQSSGCSRTCASRWDYHRVRQSARRPSCPFTSETTPQTRTPSSYCAPTAMASRLSCASERPSEARPRLSFGCSSVMWPSSSPSFCTTACSSALLSMSAPPSRRRPPPMRRHSPAPWQAS